MAKYFKDLKFKIQEYPELAYPYIPYTVEFQMTNIKPYIIAFFRACMMKKIQQYRLLLDRSSYASTDPLLVIYNVERMILSIPVVPKHDKYELNITNSLLDDLGVPKTMTVYSDDFKPKLDIVNTKLFTLTPGSAISMTLYKSSGNGLEHPSYNGIHRFGIKSSVSKDYNCLEELATDHSIFIVCSGVKSWDDILDETLKIMKLEIANFKNEIKNLQETNDECFLNFNTDISQVSYYIANILQMEHGIDMYQTRQSGNTTVRIPGDKKTIISIIDNTKLWDSKL